MDPFSIAVGVAIAAGAIFMDVRGVSMVKDHLEQHIERQARNKTLVIDQPTEKHIIDFDNKL